MKVAIFVQTDEAAIIGFESETHPSFSWLKNRYHVINLSESEIAELEEARERFNQAQRKLSDILRRLQGMSEEEIAECNKYGEAWGHIQIRGEK